MTPLATDLVRQIQATGPITIAEYMALALTHPTHGYYATRDPLGSDFTTAPEISQMFGELLGLSLAATWADTGAPRAFTLAEPGPGKGTLMGDVLRAARRVPGFTKAADIYLVEVSATLRGVQAKTLAGHAPVWIDTLDALPEAPLYLIANEFFDALPIRQFLRDAAGWRERVIGLEDEHLAFGLTDPAPIAALDHRLEDTDVGEIVTLCPAAQTAMTEIARRIATHGGTALIIDYGDWRVAGDTFQAIYKGVKADPLAHPGAADLSAHVEFEALVQIATRQGAAAHGPLPQGQVLRALGIDLRAEALARSAVSPDSVRAAHHRLTDAGEMGDLFKAIAITPQDAPAPPGFQQ